MSEQEPLQTEGEAQEPKPPKKRKRFYTRREIPDFCREVLDIPVTRSTVDKTAMNKCGPVPDLCYGKLQLYTPETIENWVFHDLCKPFSSNLRARKKEDAA